MASGRERGIASILQEMAELMKTSNGQGMLEVSVPKALMPKFLLLMRLADLRKQGVDVTDLAAKILTPEDLSTGTVERGSAIQRLEECRESRNDASEVQEDQVEDTHDAGGVYQDEPPGMVEAISEHSTNGEDSEGMQEVIQSPLTFLLVWSASRHPWHRIVLMVTWIWVLRRSPPQLWSWTIKLLLMIWRKRLEQ